MQMLLRNITIPCLADMLRRHADCSPVPYLVDPAAVRRARRLAKKRGLWADLARTLDPGREIPVIRRSVFRQFQRNGNRTLYQGKSGARLSELTRAALALWLDHPDADIDYLQDLLWAYCDDHTWVLAAHERHSVDLGSAILGATFAEILHVLGDRIEMEVKARVSAEIEKRIFQNAWNKRNVDGWHTGENNWNHVCNGSMVRTALLQLDDPAIVAHTIHQWIQNMTYALDGFADDGGCREGPSYWGYGFGHYLRAAHALYAKTGGELNIMIGDKIERICRYPLASHIAGQYCSTFSDSRHGYLLGLTALLINEFYDMPELYELCKQNTDRTLTLSGMHEFGLYNRQRATGTIDNSDCLLADMGQVKLRGASGRNQLTLMALASDNGVPHNHNDIGSFIVHRNERMLLVDPGAPVYSRKTFSAQRYESVFCNSFGHSVPVINGKTQEDGQQHYGVLAVENMDGAGDKCAIIDMSHAYPRSAGLKKFTRTFTVRAVKNTLMLEDSYIFGRKPRALEEAFITFAEVVLSSDRQSVQIGPKRGGATLRALGVRGRFAAKRLVEESKEGRTANIITRITFVPRALAKEMSLQFELD